MMSSLKKIIELSLLRIRNLHAKNSCVIWLFVLSISLGSASTGKAQSITIGDPFEMYLRTFATKLEISEMPSYLIRPVSSAAYLKKGALPEQHPWADHRYFQSEQNSLPDWVQLYTPELFWSFNKELPQGQNDGALWQGVGFNRMLSIGARVQYGPLVASIRPSMGYSENRPFDLHPVQRLAGLTKFTPPLRRVDHIQRFGEEEYSWFDWGRTYIQLEHKNAVIGWSNDHIWAGPAIFNPIAYSNNAPGFSHVFIGTDGPVNSPIGQFEGRWFWGKLEGSDYFYDILEDGTNVHYDKLWSDRILNGLILSYRPSFIPELSLGLSRTYVRYWDDEGLRSDDYIGVFIPFTKKRVPEEGEVWGQEDRIFQMITFFGRWHLPESGFEAYFEWGRTDPSIDIQDFLQQPEHTRGYMVGFLKSFDLLNSRKLTLQYEMTQLEAPRSDKLRSTVSFYTGTMHHGFTHRGQIIGAGIGYGSNNQLARVNFYDRWGMTGVSVNRIVHDNDFLYRRYDPFVIRINSPFRPQPRQLHMVSFQYGWHTVLFLPKGLELEANIYRATKILNYYNIHNNDKFNTHLTFTLRYQLPGFIR